MGHWQGPPWAGLAASAMTVVSLSWFCQLGWSQFCWLEWSNLHPIWGQDILENLLIHEGDHWLHCSAKLHYTLFHMARLAGNQWLSLFHTVVESLGVHEGLLWLLKLMVPTAKWWIWGRHGLVSLQGWGGQWCGMVVIHPHHMTSYLRESKWCSHFLCKLPMVVLARNFSQFLSPDWLIHLPSLPWYPLSLFHGGGLWVMGCHSSWEAVIHFCTHQGHLLPT